MATGGLSSLLHFIIADTVREFNHAILWRADSTMPAFDRGRVGVHVLANAVPRDCILVRKMQQDSARRGR